MNTLIAESTGRTTLGADLGCSASDIFYCEEDNYYDPVPEGFSFSLSFGLGFSFFGTGYVIAYST